MSADIELDDAAGALRSAPHDVDRFKMMRVQFFEHRLDLGIFHHLRQRFVLHFSNDLVNELRAVARLDDQHQAHRGFFQLNGRFRVGKLGSVDNVGPVYEVIEIRHRVMKNGLRQVRYEFGARLETRVMKFVTAGIAPEMRFILRREKRTLMMIEPPGQFV